ncbi:MAG: sodium:proton exchanger [Alphaproteobacteria bacterium]|nr:sodium:proton exchanger [Alphaproteobacteria bacterium]
MTHPFTSVFSEIATLLGLAAGFGVLALFLRQPLIVAFIATGIVAGGSVLGIVHSAEHVGVLAEIGIAALLFLVGLKLDIQIIRSLGRVAVATGLGQVLFTAGVGFFICLALGMNMVTSGYVAVALTFSSTIIIVKLLSDKRELDSLHGRIALGFLIVQDIAVVVAMVALSAFGVGASSGGMGLGVAGVLGGAVIMIASVAAFIRHGADPLMRRIARMPELLVTFAIAWAVLFAAVGDWIGFGKELGGLLAGVSLASTPVREAIASRLASVRDFLLLFFFIGLGSRLDMSQLGAQVPSAIVLSLFVLVGNPLIVMAIMGAMGYRKRTGFLAGLTVAQISEFSLIFMVMGMSLGHVQGDAMGLVTLVGLVTITLSTYMIIYSHHLYRWLEGYLGWSARRVPQREIAMERDDGGGKYDVILFGLGRYGAEIQKRLLARGACVLGVDFDPEAVARSHKRRRPAIYGDAEDPEFAATLPLDGVRWVIIATTPAAQGVVHEDNRVVLIKALREAGYRGCIAVRSHDARDTRRMQATGADRVLLPYSDAAEQAIDLLGFSPVIAEEMPEYAVREQALAEPHGAALDHK